MADYMQRVARNVARISFGFGDSDGTLIVVYPDTVTHPGGNPFHKQRSGNETTVTFLHVRGGWLTQRDNNEEGSGRADLRNGQAILYHDLQDTEHDALVTLFAHEGAAIDWNVGDGAVRIVLDGLVNDPLQDATVLTFHRAEVT